MLKQHGTVLLVRMPVHSEIGGWEEAYMSSFDHYMQRFATWQGVPYLKMPLDDARWSFTDGNHVTPASGAEASRIIGAELVEELGR